GIRDGHVTGVQTCALPIYIQGTLLVPKLTLESAERDLSQTELISYLMFGKPTFELGGGEGAFVRNAFSSLVAGELERTFVSDLRSEERRVGKGCRSLGAG